MSATLRLICQAFSFADLPISSRVVIVGVMGVSGKWIKALVGMKKSEKSQSSEKEENVSMNIALFSFFYIFPFWMFRFGYVCVSCHACLFKMLK